MPPINKPVRFIYADAQLITGFPLAGLPTQNGGDARELEIAIGHSSLSVCLGFETRCFASQPASRVNSRGVVEHRSWGVEPAGFQGIRVGSRFVFRASGEANFVIEPDALTVTVCPQAASSGPTLNHWLLDQVLPRVLSHHCRLVMHAAAVRAMPERAIAFLGDTGAGKSTLTASLHAAGYPLLSDDALVLKAGQNGATALPTYPSLRLWPDAIAELYEEAPPVVPMARDSTKRRVLIDAEGAATDKPVPLVALYLLERASDTAGNGISLTRLSGREACMAIISNAFQLDPTDTQRAARLMRAAADVARHVPAFSLSYPREFACLPDVCTAVIEHSRGLARATKATAASG